MWRRRLVAISLVVIVCASVWYIAPVRRAAAAGQTVSVGGYPAPGNVLTVDGAGFPFGDTIQVLYDTTVVASTFVRGLGGPISTEFITQFTIPLNTTTGAHTVTASEQTAGLSAQTTVLVKANWSQFGFGPALKRYNRYESAIDPSNVAQLALDWKVDTGTGTGAGPNLLSIADGRMFYGGDNNNQVLQAYDATTGKLLWAQPYLVIGQPAIANGVVYFSEYWHGLVALDENTGAFLWESSDNSGAGMWPVVAGGFVYFLSGYTIYAYSAAGCGAPQCKAAWTFAYGYGGNEPAVWNGHVYLGNNGGTVYVLNATTGALQWTTNAPIYGSNTLAVDAGYLFVLGLASGGALYVFNANGCGHPTCPQLWSSQSLISYAYLAAANGVVYVGARNGGTGGTLYAFSESGCGSATCAPLWTANAPEWIDSAPAVANGVVYAGASTGLGSSDFLAYNASGCGATTCSSLWDYHVSSTLEAAAPPVVIVNGMVYFVNNETSSKATNMIYAFHLPGSSAAPHSSSVRTGARRDR